MVQELTCQRKSILRCSIITSDSVSTATLVYIHGTWCDVRADYCAHIATKTVFVMDSWSSSATFARRPVPDRILHAAEIPAKTVGPVKASRHDRP